MQPLTSILIKLLLSGIVLILSRFFLNYIRSPLKAFPGPVATHFTNIWRFLDVYNGRCDITHIKLHRKHGVAVRMGPNILSLSDPSLITRIFSTKNPWKKSAMYLVKEPMVDGKSVPNLFSTTDENWHSTSIRPIIPLYSMTKLLELEHCVDGTICLFLQKLNERFVDTGKACDMAQYLLYFAWDSMSEITFGEDLGILEAGNDERKLLHTSTKDFDYFAPVCQIPQLDHLLAKNRFYRLGPPTMTWAVTLAIEACQKRQVQNRHANTDFLDKLLEVKKRYPEIVDDNMMVTYLLNNLIAGSDTIANLLCATVYYVLKNPCVHQKLRKECLSLEVPVSWRRTQQLPYLDAVMREAMRIHSGVGLMLERIVPKGGLLLPDGRFIPEGTIVGMNPWVINRDEIVFGPDPDSFTPERWLKQDSETDEQFQARRARMKGTDLTFGAGKRVCTGRYLSQLESYKLIATLFATFDMELANPEEEWKVTNAWFIRNENVRVLLKHKL